MEKWDLAIYLCPYFNATLFWRPLNLSPSVNEIWRIFIQIVPGASTSLKPSRCLGK